jgi:VWFA-related protein
LRTIAEGRVRAAARGRARVEAALFLVVSLATPATPAALRQEKPAPSADPVPRFPTGTAAVLLDLVVRDKKGRSVGDLREDELEVFQDGVKQKIETFKRVEGEPAPADAAPAGNAPLAQPDTSRSPNLVTLVFDQLDIEGRKLAQKAAASFLEKALRPQVFVSVFQIDQRLGLLQPFTADAGALKEAVARATSGAYRGVTDEQTALTQAQEEVEKLAAAAPESGQGGAPSGAGFAARAQAQAVANMLRLSNTLQRQQQGSTSLYPLLALVRGQQALAGRKTLLYISQGLQVPPSLEAVFRSTISAANLSNVSFYAIDARGLNVERAMGASRDALEQARRVSQRTMESRGVGAVQKDEVQLSETAESALRLNVEGTLADLSESTGGFLIANTNDFRQGVERMAADLAGHYELTYLPPPAPFDGRFRSIEVKTSRKGITVQTRSGYFALPPGESSALFPYEMPLLAALTLQEPPRDFDLRAAALRFAGTPQGSEHKLVVEIPVSRLKMITDLSKKTYKVHFSLLALVKSPGGEVVERFSEDYPFEGPIAKAEQLKLGNIVFKRRLTLPQGRYTLEVAGQDREVGSMSVVRQPLDVPAGAAAPQMSSLLLIRRIEAAPPAAAADGDPLDVSGMRIVPNLDAPVSAATNTKLSFFFIAYPGATGEKPKMTLEFSRDGKAVGRAQPELPAPEADGRIRYVGTFPITSFPPARYDVRVALALPEGRCEEHASFTIVP